MYVGAFCQLLNKRIFYCIVRMNSTVEILVFHTFKIVRPQYTGEVGQFILSEINERIMNKKHPIFYFLVNDIPMKFDNSVVKFTKK